MKFNVCTNKMHKSFHNVCTGNMNIYRYIILDMIIYIYMNEFSDAINMIYKFTSSYLIYK